MVAVQSTAKKNPELLGRTPAPIMVQTPQVSRLVRQFGRKTGETGASHLLLPVLRTTIEEPTKGGLGIRSNRLAFIGSQVLRGPTVLIRYIRCYLKNEGSFCCRRRRKADCGGEK